LLGGPALLAALAVGIIVGIGQTLTQMHEPVIGLVPRVLAVLLIMLIALPWLISVWVEFARTMIGGIPELLTASVESISRIA
jgi:flagellar biosynthesis protein FliQ